MVHAGCDFVASIPRLGHECQDLLSPYDGMCVCTDYIRIPRVILSSERVGERGKGRDEVRNHLKSKGKIPITGGTEEVQTRVMLHHAGQRAYQHITN